MNTLTALKRSALGLDLYLWLTYRTFTLRAPLHLSWRQVYRQFGVNPAKADDHYTVKNFRKDCLRELGKIKVAWPDLNYTTAPGRLDPVSLGSRHRSGAATSTRGIALVLP